VATHYSGTKGAVRALDAYIKLMRAADSVQAGLERALEAEGLTEGQFGVLEILLHLGPSAPGEIARKLFRSEGNVTVLLDNLERRGWIERRRDAADRRRHAIHLTAAGRAEIRKRFPPHVERVVAAFSHLSAAEQDELGRLCRKLGRGIRGA
jgi:MarR family 2-MHQ and catechol resistance regulon transcriptional repressor